MRRIALLSFLLILAGAQSGCEPQTPVAPDAQLTKLDLQSSGPITFTGRTTFEAYLSRDNQWFLHPEVIWCPVDAELRLLGDQDIELDTTESGGCGGRTIYWTGKMTPGGALKLYMPEPWPSQVAAHTGCTLTGTFPVYHGHFDGQSLNAGGQFHGHCDGGSIWGPMFGFPDDAGPVHVTFAYELTRD